MGRSVSYATGSIAIAYADIGYFGNEYDEDGNVIVDENDCPVWDDVIVEMDREQFHNDIIVKAKAQWPSLEECGTWLDNEDLAILENEHCYIGVSEYCGLASIWLVPKDTDYNQDFVGISRYWCESIETKFEKMFSEFRKIGSFSNGEAVFEKVG